MTKLSKRTSFQYLRNIFRYLTLYYFGVGYMQRPPIHIESIQNNKSTISQE